jgi:hypothetical protein
MASPFLSGLASAKWTSLPHRGGGGTGGLPAAGGALPGDPKVLTRSVFLDALLSAMTFSGSTVAQFRNTPDSLREWSMLW